MRVGVDMLYAQSSAALHGIGNYSFSHVMHLAHHPDVEIYYFEPVYDGLSRQDYAGSLSQFIHNNNLDIFHLPSPMQVPYPELFGSDDLPPVRMTALMHDIIPLIYPEHHLRTESARSRYNEYLRMLRKMHHLFTNSEYTRQDLLQIGFRPDKVTAVSAGCDDCFYPVHRASLDDMKELFPIHDPYVIAFTPWDFRKNAERLIEAFGHATRTRGEKWQIVFVNGIPSEDVRHRLGRIAREHGIDGRIRYVGRVTKSQLLRLYRCARAVALPTLYEGFGLPALEGMQCGTPVLTSNTSSMPEVVGNAAVQVDPCDVKDIERGLRKILFDHAIRERLKSEGIKRASQFQWQDVAERTVAIYKRLVHEVPLHRRRSHKPSKIRLKPNWYMTVKGVQRKRKTGTFLSFDVAKLSHTMKIGKAVLRIAIPRSRGAIRVYKVKSRRSQDRTEQSVPPIHSHPSGRAHLNRRRRNGQRVYKCRCTRWVKKWMRNPPKNRGLFIPVSCSRPPRLVLTVKRRRKK